MGSEEACLSFYQIIIMWFLVSEINKKDQANILRYNTWQNTPEFFLELVDVQNKEVREDKTIEILEKKLGIPQQTRNKHKLNSFYDYNSKKEQYFAKYEWLNKDYTNLQITGNQTVKIWIKEMNRIFLEI